MKYNEIYHITGIYGIKNIINGKTYIGKTMMNFGDRWDSHKALLRQNKHDNRYLQNAWNKYGEDNFNFFIVEQCNDNDKINDLEIKYIAQYRTLNNCYNISDGGDGGYNLGKHLSDETKKKIGMKNKINMTGKKHSSETRLKMSKAQSERWRSMSESEKQEWSSKMNEIRGYKWSDESKERMKDNKNGAKYTIEEVREIRRLHEKEEKSFLEISKIMNIPKPAVYLIATYRRWKNAV